MSIYQYLFFQVVELVGFRSQVPASLLWIVISLSVVSSVLKILQWSSDLSHMHDTQWPDSDLVEVCLLAWFSKSLIC